MSEILVDLAFLPKTCARCNPPKTDMKPEHLITGKGGFRGREFQLTPPTLGSWFGLGWCNMQDAWSALCESAIQRGSKAETEGSFTYSYFASKVGKCALWVLDVWCFSRFPRENRRWGFFGLNTEAYRSKQIFDIWTEVWSGQRNRLKYVISTQAAPWRQKEDEITVKGRSRRRSKLFFVELPHVAVLPFDRLMWTVRTLQPA